MGVIDPINIQFKCIILKINWKILIFKLSDFTNILNPTMKQKNIK